MDGGAVFYLALIGGAAALWGLYSISTRGLSGVPSSALGVFYMLAAFLCLGLHLSVEEWVTPDPSELAAIAGLGILPMGLAIYLWDYGCKHGDIMVLGALSYAAPVLSVIFLLLFGYGAFHWSVAVATGLIAAGALIAAKDMLFKRQPA